MEAIAERIPLPLRRFRQPPNGPGSPHAPLHLPPKNTPTLLSQPHYHFTQTQETRDLPPHFLLAPPKLATIRQEIHKPLQLTALSTTWQQQAAEFLSCQNRAEQSQLIQYLNFQNQNLLLFATPDEYTCRKDNET